MRIIALMNQKGGVGKTTTTANLGAAIAEAGKSVLLVDLDPQAHLTINYGVDPDPKNVSIYDVLVEDRGLLEATRKIDDRIALVPSSIDLAAAEIELVSVLGREIILKERVEAAQLEFDYMLIDCPPSLGLLTINALAVADEVIIPMQPHFLALQGVAKLLETVQLVNKRMNPSLPRRRNCAHDVRRTGQAFHGSRQRAEELHRLGGRQGAAVGERRIFDTRIRRNIKLAECPSFGKTIIGYDPASNGTADYRALAAEVMAMDAATAVASPKLELELHLPPMEKPASPVSDEVAA